MRYGVTPVDGTDEKHWMTSGAFLFGGGNLLPRFTMLRFYAMVELILSMYGDLSVVRKPSG